MELATMVCIVLLLSLGASWISNTAIILLEKHYFSRALSLEHAAWLRVGMAVILYCCVLMVPPAIMVYTIKLVALANIAIQLMKLNGVYNYRRREKAGLTQDKSDQSRFNPFRKK